MEPLGKPCLRPTSLNAGDTNSPSKLYLNILQYNHPYPIPTDDRSLTGGALTQNPGWNDGLDF